MFNKLYRYTVLTMGLKPAQGELNAALAPLFQHIPSVHLIHDDVIIATDTEEEHLAAIRELMQAIASAGMTLNPKKCQFMQKEIRFWGMIIGEYGVRPDPEKINDLRYITPPENKQELVSFLCMLQSNSEFIPQFAKKSAILRELTRASVHFQWKPEHQQCFDDLIADFKEDVSLRFFDTGKRSFVITDAHKSGLGAILVQGDDLTSAKAVAVASRRTTTAEQHYPQIDLEGTAVDYGLSRFRNYLVGAPDVIVVITDHKPLVSIFNGRRKGSIRTEKIKLRNQDIEFTVQYQKGQSNQADYLSRHAKPFELASEEDQANANEVSKLLYFLHTTPIVDRMELSTIAEETSKDPILAQLRDILMKLLTWIPKNAPEPLRKFAKTMPELTVTGNGIILKSDRMVLPASLQPMAIQLAHRGSHPAQSGMERRLRSHFFFHDMDKKVSDFLSTCQLCATFSDKKTSEPQGRHEVPLECWDTVAVDLFGPMPSKNHVVVVQDLASKFPAAKLVSSTSAEQVLPALSDICDSYGNPAKLISDNGPPFNSRAMDGFARKRGIQLQKIPPLHPSSNPAETFMRPLGKTMKIAHASHTREDEALQTLLSNYRNTPHPATGISPASMLFRDGVRSVFPRQVASEKEVQAARTRDLDQKKAHQEKVNSGKFRISSHYALGETVLVRNYKKTRKFEPVFLPQQFVIVDISDNQQCLTLEGVEDGLTLKRHPDDVKKFAKPPTSGPREEEQFSEREILQEYRNRLSAAEEEDYDDGSPWDTAVSTERPTRTRQRNPRYYNEDFVNSVRMQDRR